MNPRFPLYKFCEFPSSSLLIGSGLCFNDEAMKDSSLTFPILPRFRSLPKPPHSALPSSHFSNDGNRTSAIIRDGPSYFLLTFSFLLMGAYFSEGFPVKDRRVPP